MPHCLFVPGSAECRRIWGACVAFIGMYEMMQMEALSTDVAISDISVEIPELCDSGPCPYELAS